MVVRKFDQGGSPPSGAPYSVVLFDRQYYLAAGACFVRHVRQIHEETAADKLSQINIPFSPQGESICLHWIRIWRDGQAIEQISSEDDVELRQGTAASGQVIHHALQDLRAGDTLDIAYSTKALAPRPHFSATHPIRQRVPVLDWHLSVISPEQSPINSQCHREDLEPTVRTLADGSQFLHWNLKDVPKQIQVTNVPTWYQPNPELQLSNFNSWLDVASDVYHHWKLVGTCEQAGALAESLAAGTESEVEPWEAARRACRFVQDEVLTSQSSTPGAAPAARPEETLDCRQGDAAAKACLLVSLLRALRIPSAPVLVSKSRMGSVGGAIPAPDWFDHVIVRGRIADTDFWIDPCATHEAGPIRSSTIPAYLLGLQISARSSDLCAIPKPDPRANKLVVTEHFVVDRARHTQLKVTTRASGTAANALRAEVADKCLEVLSLERLADLQRSYPDATSGEAITLDDISDTNEILIEEEFEIAKLVESSQGAAIFRPAQLCRHLPDLPDQAAAHEHPWAIDFPCSLRHSTIIDTPWSIETGESSESFPGTAFTFSFKGSTEGTRHTLHWAYDAHDDHLSAIEIPSACVRLKSIRPLVRYDFQPPLAPGQKPPKAKKSKKPHSPKEKRSDTDRRQRKSAARNAPSILKPIIAGVGALVLFFIVKSSFKNEAIEKREAIMEKKLVGKAAAMPPVEAAKDIPIMLPDDPLSFLPPPPPPPGPEGLDDLKFDIGDGKPNEVKASEEKNATSADWKLTK